MASYKPNSNQTRQLIISALLNRDGSACNICKKPLEERKFVIEHRDGDPSNYTFDNLQLACFSCNQRKRAISNGSTGNIEREKESAREETTDSEQITESKIEQRKRKANMQRAAPEIKINRNSEPKFRRYLWENVNREGGLTVTDAIHEGAEYAECSPETTTRYLNKFTSRLAPFDTKEVDTKEVGSTDIVILRAGYSPNISTALGRLDIEILKEQQERQRLELEEERREAELLRKDLYKAEDEIERLRRENSNLKGKTTP